MTLQQKLNAIDTLSYTDASGVVWRLPTAARRHAEQLVRDNPRLTIPQLLPRVPLDEPLAIPTL